MYIDKFDFLETLIREEFPENQEKVIVCTLILTSTFNNLNSFIQTEEEIEKLMIKEDLSQVQKGVLILKKGQEIQKKAVRDLLSRNIFMNKFVEIGHLELRQIHA